VTWAVVLIARFCHSTSWKERSERGSSQNHHNLPNGRSQLAQTIMCNDYEGTTGEDA
jgi:hypothetical protein